MAMGAEDGGEGRLSSLRPVKVPGREESGKTCESDIFDAVAGIFAPAVNDGIERAFLGRRPQPGTLQDAGAHLPGTGLPLFECRAAAAEFGQLMLAGRLAEVISLAELGPISCPLLARLKLKRAEKENEDADRPYEIEKRPLLTHRTSFQALS
jgi:hypothetical protein